jgi:hypothetical protein
MKMIPVSSTISRIELQILLPEELAASRKQVQI